MKIIMKHQTLDSINIWKTFQIIFCIYSLRIPYLCLKFLVYLITLPSNSSYDIHYRFTSQLDVPFLRVIDPLSKIGAGRFRKPMSGHIPKEEWHFVCTFDFVDWTIDYVETDPKECYFWKGNFYIGTGYTKVHKVLSTHTSTHMCIDQF